MLLCTSSIEKDTFILRSTPSRASAATRQPCPAWMSRTRSVRARHVHVYTIGTITYPASLPCPALPSSALPARSLALPGYRRLVYRGRGRITSTGTRPAGGAAPAAAAAATFTCGCRPLLTTICLGPFRIFFAAGLCTAHLQLLYSTERICALHGPPSRSWPRRRRSPNSTLLATLPTNATLQPLSAVSVLCIVWFASFPCAVFAVRNGMSLSRSAPLPLLNGKNLALPCPSFLAAAGAGPLAGVVGRRRLGGDRRRVLCTVDAYRASRAGQSTSRPSSSFLDTSKPSKEPGMARGNWARTRTGHARSCIYTTLRAGRAACMPRWRRSVTPYSGGNPAMAHDARSLLHPAAYGTTVYGVPDVHWAPSRHEQRSITPHPPSHHHSSTSFSSPSFFFTSNLVRHSLHLICGSRRAS